LNQFLLLAVERYNAVGKPLGFWPLQAAFHSLYQVLDNCFRFAAIGATLASVVDAITNVS